jgi:hypothetical protein
VGEGDDKLRNTGLKAALKADLNGDDRYDRLFLNQSPNIPMIIRSAFEEINGQKLIKKTTVGVPAAR